MMYLNMGDGRVTVYFRRKDRYFQMKSQYFKLVFTMSLMVLVIVGFFLACSSDLLSIYQFPDVLVVQGFSHW